MATPLEGGTIVNFDAGLRVATQYDPYGSTGNPNQPWYYSYDPGLVLWYRDMGYTDNWTGAHPGHGYLLVVDAHDQARLRPPAAGLGVLPFNTHVQSSDAAFGLDRTAPLTLGYWGVVKTDPAQGAMAGFDDAHTYWSILAPNAGVITPTYGLVLRVLGKAPDGSAAVIGVGTK
jgi:immune inhibitor A